MIFFSPLCATHPPWMSCFSHFTEFNRKPKFLKKLSSSSYPFHFMILLTAWTVEFCSCGNIPQVTEVEILTHASYFTEEIPLHLVYKLMFLKSSTTSKCINFLIVTESFLRNFLRKMLILTDLLSKNLDMISITFWGQNAKRSELLKIQSKQTDKKYYQL